MKSITTNKFSFEQIINDQNVYVDKTALLLPLVREVGGQFFISRPRRFGKSLMLSTLQAIFEGRKELFEGHAISNADYDWKKYPVLMIDMAKVSAMTPQGIAYNLVSMVMQLASQLGFEIEKNDDPSVTFENFWKEISNRKIQVVVLVDEYDMPLQGCLGNSETLETVCQMMHDFYVRFKSYSANIRFLMITGVTKFARLSIFSGLNQLNDLTMDAPYATLLGYTHEELKKYFSEHIDAFAKQESVASQEIIAQLLEWYDHYRFAPKNEARVLNPTSVGFCLLKCTFDKYWNATGSSSLIAERLCKAGKWPTDLECVPVLKEDLDVFDAGQLPVVPLLYQGGYLTIKEADGNLLTLGIPNQEVRSAIVSGHISSLLNADKGAEFATASALAARALQNGDLQRALDVFRSTIAALPYEWLINDEGGAKIAFLDFFNAMRRTQVHAERQIANGRIDAIVETSDAFYIFEFKYNRSAQEAFDQILEKDYHKPYMICGKKVYGIGLNFNPKSGSRGIDEPIVQLLQE